MLDALVGGTVQGTPQRRPGKAETTFVTAKVRALAGDKESVTLVNVIVFDEATATSNSHSPVSAGRWRCGSTFRQHHTQGLD